MKSQRATAGRPAACPGSDCSKTPEPEAPQKPPTDAIKVAFGPPKFGSITATVSNSSDLKADCTYDATPFDTHRDFSVPAKGSTPLTFNGVNTGLTYHTVTECSADFNGARTVIGRVEQDVTF